MTDQVSAPAQNNIELAQMRNQNQSLLAQLEAHRQQINENLQTNLNMRTNLVMFQKALSEAQQKIVTLEAEVKALKPVVPTPVES